MKTITLTLTIDETNLILEGVGRMPFAKVYALVAKIQQQAKAQVADGEKRPALARSSALAPADSDDEAGHVQ